MVVRLTVSKVIVNFPCTWGSLVIGGADKKTGGDSAMFPTDTSNSWRGGGAGGSVSVGGGGGIVTVSGVDSWCRQWTVGQD